MQATIFYMLELQRHLPTPDKIGDGKCEISANAFLLLIINSAASFIESLSAFTERQDASKGLGK